MPRWARTPLANWKGNKRLIVYQSTGATQIHFGIDAHRIAEKHQSLIDQVAAEVVEQATGIFGRGIFAPGFETWHGPVAVKMRLEARDRAELVVGEQLAHSEKIVMPAAVLENSE